MVKRVLQFMLGLKLCVLSLLSFGMAGIALGDAVEYHLLYALLYVTDVWVPDKAWGDMWASIPGVVFAYLLFCTAVLLGRLGVRLMFRFALSRVRFYWAAAVLWLGCLASEILFAAENRAGMSGCCIAGWCVLALTFILLILLCLWRRSSSAEKPLQPGVEKEQ
jgi:hypothetical protein